MHMSMESIVPKYEQIRSRIVGRVGFGMTHCPALTLLLLCSILLLQHCCCCAAAPSTSVDKQTSWQTNKHPGMTIRLTLSERDAILASGYNRVSRVMLCLGLGPGFRVRVNVICPHKMMNYFPCCRHWLVFYMCPKRNYLRMYWTYFYKTFRLDKHVGGMIILTFLLWWLNGHCYGNQFFFWGGGEGIGKNWHIPPSFIALAFHSAL